MNKFLAFILVVFLVGLASLTPLAMGYYIKLNASRLIAFYSQTYNANVKIQKYRVDWLNSTILLQIKPTAFHDNVAINIETNLTHGPVVYNNDTGKLTFAIAKFESTLSFDVKQLSVTSAKTNFGNLLYSGLVTFDGLFRAHIHAPAATIGLQNGGSIKWEGADGNLEGQFDPRGRIISFRNDFDFGAFSAVSPSPKMQLNIHPINFRYAGHLDTVGLWVGQLSLETAGILFKNQNGQTINLVNFSFVNTNDITANYYNGAEQFTWQKLEIPNNSIVTDISPGMLTLSINNLNAKQYMEFLNFYKTVNTLNMPKDVIRKQYMIHVLNIMTQNSEFDASASFKTPLGTVDMQGKIFWPTDVALPTSSQELMNNINMQVDVKAAAPLMTKFVNLYVQQHGDAVTQMNMTQNITQAVNKVASPPKPNLPVTSSNDDPFNKAIAVMMQQGKVPLAMAVQILDLHSKHLSEADFINGLQQFKLPPQTVVEIVKLNAVTNVALAAPTPPAPPTPPPAPTEMTNEDAAKVLMTQWIKKGYLIPDGDTYAFSITRAGGVSKVNGLSWSGLGLGQ